MKKLFFSMIFLFSPVFAGSFSQCINCAEMWWCSGCGLAYPTSQKVCVNKDCPMFRASRKKR